MFMVVQITLSICEIKILMCLNGNYFSLIATRITTRVMMLFTMIKSSGISVVYSKKTDMMSIR
ncbi:hypothetical protein SDC9_149563 [bioreactor metagenome]|uniref:Uncharacterized protein n=1 Tax=bioreactor metagenome TaxID=1076179 RepID=A0A645EKN9_9ZZZZ